MLEKLQSISKMIFLLIGVLVGGIYYWTNMDSLEEKERAIEAKKAEIQTVDQALKSAKKVADDKPKFEEENSKIGEQLRAAIDFLPNKLNEQDVLAKISNEARSAGVNPRSIQPKKAQQKEFYEELQMDVEMEGSYTQLVLFLSYISKIPRIVNIRNLELKFDQFVDDVPVLKLKGTLVAYRYIDKPIETQEQKK